VSLRCGAPLGAFRKRVLATTRVAVPVNHHPCIEQSKIIGTIKGTMGHDGLFSVGSLSTISARETKKTPQSA